MVNYNKSSIYKLCCKDINIKEEYVGSTTRFERRKAEHKYLCCHDSHINVYKFIREKGGFENWDMIQIEEVNVNNKRELETRERYWIEFLKAELNKVTPTQTITEWRPKYLEKNKVVLTEKSKKYYENNREVILDKHKKYRENNREVLAEYAKEYRKNKKIEKIKCKCGSEIYSLEQHKKTKKHLNFIDQSHEQI